MDTCTKVPRKNFIVDGMEKIGHDLRCDLCLEMSSLTVQVTTNMDHLTTSAITDEDRLFYCLPCFQKSLRSPEDQKEFQSVLNRLDHVIKKESQRTQLRKRIHSKRHSNQKIPIFQKKYSS